MTLTDAGPLVALIDADEPQHDRCRMVVERIALPLVTTWPAFTEATYLLSRAGGQLGQEVLCRLLLSRGLALADLPRSTLERNSVQMTQYADLPMVLADATLVALAEERGDRRVFTRATDFQVYRLPGRHRFEIVPGGGRASQQRHHVSHDWKTYLTTRLLRWTARPPGPLPRGRGSEHRSIDTVPNH